MTFLNPLGLVALLLVPIVILFHFLRLKRQEKIVSSTILWERALRDYYANTWWKKIRKNILLWLQILTVVLLALALSRPCFPWMGKEGGNVMIVLDTSASMLARDVSPNRWTVARREAEKIVDKLGRNQQVMLLETGLSPRIVVALTGKKEEVLKGIASLSPREVPADLEKVLQFARSLKKAYRIKNIYFISDGGGKEFNREVWEGERDLEWRHIGKGNDNVGITAFSVRKSYRSNFDYEVFLTLQNFSNESRSFPFTIRGGDKIFYQQKFSLAGGEKKSLVIPVVSRGENSIEAFIDIRDDLPIDDRSYGIIPFPPPISVLLVSKEGYFLQKALRLHPRVILKVIPPQDWASGQNVDVTIFDGYSPSEIGEGNYIFIRATARNLPLQVVGEQESVSVLDWNRQHPLTRYLDFSRLRIQRAWKVNPPSGSQILVGATSGPLILGWEGNNRQVLWINFYLQESDFPLQVAFPVFLSQALDWLVPLAGYEQEGRIRAGETANLRVDPRLREVKVIDPRGGVKLLPVERGRIMVEETNYQGYYLLEAGSYRSSFAVSLLSEEESNIQPRIPPLAPLEEERGWETGQRFYSELWRYLVFLVILLLMLEWYFYQKFREGLV